LPIFRRTPTESLRMLRGEASSARHVVIIGNGIAGITLARELRKRSQDRITVISSETRHFFSRPALMYVYMGHMQFEHTKPYEDWFWEKNRIELVHDRVDAVDFARKTLRLATSEAIAYDVLVLATGSQPNRLGWPGQDLHGVQGFYSYHDLLNLEKNTPGVTHAVVTGGGLIGVELAEMLMTRGIQVTFLVREKLFWSAVLPREESLLVERHIREHHVDLRMQSELKEIVGNAEGRVIRTITQDGSTIDCGIVGLTVGVSPNIAFLKGGELETDRGILVDAYLRTNIPDVYAVGDCAQFRSPLPGRRPIEQVWYTGKMQAEFLAHTLAGELKPYSPGIWFNSAKFFDIEYQTYGDVPAQQRIDEDSLYWEHPNGKKAVRIQYRKADGIVKGFNFLGIRARHQVCEHWIAERRTLEHVLENLGALNFDPEFFAGFENEVIAQYNAMPTQQPLRPLRLETRKGLFSKLMRGLQGKAKEKNQSTKAKA
jgi:NAD(P)H-nitrite reductase large subunit